MMFASFWLEASVQKTGVDVSSVSKGDLDAHFVVTVENCSGFPSDVIIESELPQLSTGVLFYGKGRCWSEKISKLPQRKDRQINRRLDLSSCKHGIEPIHARVSNYTDLCAGTVHKISGYNDYYLEISVK